MSQENVVRVRPSYSVPRWRHPALKGEAQGGAGRPRRNRRDFGRRNHVIVGIVVMIVWSFLLGLIITLVGLIAFGGFARGKWY